MNETTENADIPVDAAVPDHDEATDAVGPEDVTAALQAEIAGLKDQLLRALAEQENIRRRAAREREDALKYGAQNFGKDLLSSADNLRRAIDSVKPDQVQDEVMRNLLAGIVATERELLAAFEKNGLKQINPEGEKFDHNLHQAIFEVEQSGKVAGTVVQVLQAGYVLNDRLLRPAMVGVAKGPVAEPAAPAEEAKPDSLHQRVNTTA